MRLSGNVAALDFPKFCRIAKSSGMVRRRFQEFTIGTLEEAEEDSDEDAISASLEVLS